MLNSWPGYYDLANNEKIIRYEQGIKRGENEELKSWLSRCAKFLDEFNNPLLMSNPEIATNIRQALNELESHLLQDISENKMFFSENKYWVCNLGRSVSVIGKDQFQALANWYSQVYEKPTADNKAKRNFCIYKNDYDAYDEAEINAHAKFRAQMEEKNRNKYLESHIHQHNGPSTDLVKDVCALIQEKYRSLPVSKHNVVSSL